MKIWLNFRSSEALIQFHKFFHIRHAYNYLFCLLRIVVIDNLEDFRLQVFEGLYTVTQSELLKLMLSDDHLTPLEDLFVRRTTQL